MYGGLGMYSQYVCFYVGLYVKTLRHKQLECGPMPNVVASALPNIGGALCSMPQSLTDTRECRAVTLRSRETR